MRAFVQDVVPLITYQIPEKMLYAFKIQLNITYITIFTPQTSKQEDPGHLDCPSNAPNYDT